MSSEEKTLRIAFLGCGFATGLHSRTLKGADVERYYASRDGARAEEFRARFAGAGAFGSYRAALEAPEIDVVLIATPPDSHLPLTLDALRAGKHVVVEKPPYLSTADFDEAARAAQSAGRRLMVAENYHYKPLARAIRAALVAGDVGDVRVISINALKHQETGDWRDDPARSGGGALFEGGIHWINFLANLGPTPRALTVHPAGTPGAPERTVVATLEYEEGAVATLMYSWEVGSPLRGLRLSAIYGTEGTITFESNGIFLFVRGRRRRLSTPGVRDLLGYRAMFDDFLRAIRTGAEPEYDLATARRDLELIESARRF